MDGLADPDWWVPLVTMVPVVVATALITRLWCYAKVPKPPARRQVVTTVHREGQPSVQVVTDLPADEVLNQTLNVDG